MRSFSVFDSQLDERRDHPGFSWRRAKVGDAIGAEKMGGASLDEIAPGERTHYWDGES